MSSSNRPPQAHGTPLINVVIYDDKASIELTASYRLMSDRIHPASTERQTINNALSLIFAYGRQLVDNVLTEQSSRRQGYNIPSDSHFHDGSQPICLFQIYVPEGKDLDPTESLPQIVPNAGARRMLMRDWNALIGRRLIDAAFAHALNAGS